MQERSKHGRRTKPRAAERRLMFESMESKHLMAISLVAAYLEPIVQSPEDCGGDEVVLVGR